MHTCTRAATPAAPRAAVASPTFHHKAQETLRESHSAMAHGARARESVTGALSRAGRNLSLPFRTLRTVECEVTCGVRGQASTTPMGCRESQVALSVVARNETAEAAVAAGATALV